MLAFLKHKHALGPGKTYIFVVFLLFLSPSIPEKTKDSLWHAFRFFLHNL